MTLNAGLANYTSLSNFMFSYGSVSELREFNLKKMMKNVAIWKFLLTHFPINVIT